MTGCRQPCPSCPWRVDQTAADIPNFQITLAEDLAASCPDDRGFGPDFGSPVFACHQSRPSDEVVCTGWLAVVGNCHPMIRLKVMLGGIKAEALAPGPGWPVLHTSFQQVIEKLRRTSC